MDPRFLPDSGGKPSGPAGQGDGEMKEAEDLQDLSTGDMATILGLRSDACHNDQVVELLSWDAANERWNVQLPSGEELAIKPVNLARRYKKAGITTHTTRSMGHTERKITAEPVLHLLQSVEAQFHGVDWKTDFVVERLTPLVTEIIGELLDKEPDDVLVHGAIWLSHKAGAPEELASNLKQWQKHVCTPATKTQEERDAEELVEREKTNRQCTFTFLDAEWVRNANITSLPSYQDLQKMEGALHELTLNIDDAYRGKYREDILTVSHRWEEPEVPDAKGVQFEAMKSFLKSAGKKKKLMWYDFSSLPQGKRTRDQLIRFRWMLQNANVLYLGTDVLILLDISYLSRFWTQFEAWLSMQRATSKGLEAAPEDHRRCTIECIHNATNHEKEKLRSMWATRRPQEAKQVLGAPDVTLTCAGDRFVQFQKIDTLDSEVQCALDASCIDALMNDGEGARSMAAMGFDASQLKDAGFSAAQLRDAGFSASQMHFAGFSVSQLEGGGYSACELKDAGFTLSQLKDAGFSAAKLKDAGYSATLLEVAGLDFSQMFPADFIASKLEDAGFSALQLKDAASTFSQVKDAGLSAAQRKDVSELKDAGYSASELKDAGFTASQLKDAGFSVLQLKDAGCSASQLKDAGCGFGQLKKAGFSAAQLKVAGFSAFQLIGAGFCSPC